MLEYIPDHFEVVRHILPACSCRKCEAMMQAPMPELPIPRGMAGAGFLAHIATSKFCDWRPSRQHCTTALGFGPNAFAFCDEGYSVQLPDGRALTMATSPRFYKDAKAWATSVKKDVAAEVWDAAGQFTAGKAWTMAG